MKFLQVHVFYPGALDSVYSREPSLVSKSFKEQTEAIIKDGFSGIHMFAPYMHKVGYDGTLIVANNIRAQVQWLKENNLRAPDDRNTWLDVARMQIDFLKPDILYLSEPIVFDSRFVRSLTHKPKLILGWRAANVSEDTDWSSFDVILSNLDAMRDIATKLGADSSEFFFPGMPEWMWDEVKNIKPEFDVSFCGQVSLTAHKKRNALLDLIASESFKPDSGFTCGFYLSGNPEAMTPALIQANKGSRFGVEMQKALRTGRIVFDGRGDIGLISGSGQSIDLAKKQTSNMRIFEATGSGVMLLTEHHDNLNQYFEVGKEIASFTDKDDLLEKIKYYTSHPQERDEIARLGQERCFRDYSMTNRCKAFDEIIKKHLAKKNTASSRVNSSSKTVGFTDNEQGNESLITQAFLDLNSGNNVSALSKLNNCTAGLEYARSIALVRMNKIEDAKRALERCLQLDPTHNKAQMLIAEIAKKDNNKLKDLSIGVKSEKKDDFATVKNFITLAIKELRAENLKEAFDLLSKAKATRIPVEGLDATRAMIFMKVGHLLEARESILEELRLFPNNEDAKVLRETIEKETESLLHTDLGDDQFKEIFKIIRPYTMLHEQRLFSIYTLAKQACINDLPGNTVECGVAAGGTSAMIAWISKTFSKRPRMHFSFDTFEGMPEATDKDISSSGVLADDTGWGTGTCAAPIDSLMEIAKKLGVEDMITPVKGYFEDTLPDMVSKIGTISFMHLDADWYESTKTVLNLLYDQIHDNGFVQLDDYGCWQGCRTAVEEFQNTRKILLPLKQIDGNGVWFTKSLVTKL